MTLVIYGIEDFFESLKDHMDEFEQMLKTGKELEKLSIILIDANYILKKQEMNSWYRNYVMNDHGIWVGNGITDQFTIKLSKTPKFCYDEISKEYGYVVKNGIPVFVKLLEGEKSE